MGGRSFCEKGQENHSRNPHQNSEELPTNLCTGFQRALRLKPPCLSSRQLTLVAEGAVGLRTRSAMTCDRNLQCQHAVSTRCSIDSILQRFFVSRFVSGSLVIWQGYSLQNLKKVVKLRGENLCKILHGLAAMILHSEGCKPCKTVPDLLLHVPFSFLFTRAPLRPGTGQSLYPKCPLSENPKCGSGQMWHMGAQGGSAKAPARNNAPGGSTARATRAWRKHALLSSATP